MRKPLRNSIGNRDTYLDRRKKAEEFRESERGKYAIAQALAFFLHNHNQVWNKELPSTDTVEDIQYLLSTIYIPYLWGGERWYGDSS